MKQSVQSVLNQALQNFEFLILDDGSTDGSYEYLQGLEDSKIQLFKNETNKGLFFNLNFLINKSNTPLIKLWAQDDIMSANCLSAFVNFHQQHPDLGFSYSGRDIIDENGVIRENNHVDNTPQIISTELHARIAYHTGSIAGNIANVCINKKALGKAGPFNEQMKISADFDMWVRLAKEHETGFICQKLIQLRDHSGQLSRKEKYYINHVKEDLEVYRYLNSYVSNELRQDGKKIMRSHKLVFYYTLMIKALLQGKTKVALQFFQQLKDYDNIFLLSLSFLRTKIMGVSEPSLDK